MIVSLLSENLQKKLLFVSHAISNRSQLPVLLNFLIEAKDGSLNISATDLEIGIKVEIPASVKEEGSTTIPAKTFTELMSVVPPGKISLTKKEGGLELLGEKIKTIFQTTPPDDFPKLYEQKGKEILKIKKEGIDKELQRIVFASSQDSGRPALSGVLIKEEKEGFLLVATDGYRLSLKKLLQKNNQKAGENISIIVPSRVVRELIFMAKEEGEVVAFVSKESNQIIFSQNGTTLIGRLIEAEFPAYEKIIPTDFSTKTVFDKEQMQKAVKACYVFAKETANIVKLSIGKEKILVSSNTPSVGENTIEVEAKTAGEENEIAFNARYLLELFLNTNDEAMSFEMSGPLNPGVFRPINDPSFMHLIMPIRVQVES